MSPTLWDLIPNGLGFVFVECQGCDESNQVRWVPGVALWLVTLLIVFPTAIPLLASTHIPLPIGVVAFVLLLFFVYRVFLLAYFRYSQHPFARRSGGR
jgi:hypothetical protein